MLKRRHINSSRAARAAASWWAAAEIIRGPVERLAWALETRLLWRGGDRLRGAFDVLRWPFERLVWLTEQRLLWPLGERAAGWKPPGGGAAAAGVLAAIAAGAVLLVVMSTSGGEPVAPQAAAPVRATVASAPAPAPSPSPAPPKPVLHGVTPSFKPPSSFKAVKGIAPSQPIGGAKAEATKASPAAEKSGEAEAVASRAKPVPAGPVAMRTARRFSEAFVFYEIGKKPQRAKAVFSETATEQLAGALDERPPRLPAAGKVPKAKVVNLVPGPRIGKQYTVSVSLLRVGVTSELRLTLQKEGDGEWRVASIVG